MEQIEQAVMYALGPQVEPNLKAQVNFSTNVSDELRTFFINAFYMIHVY